MPKAEIFFLCSFLFLLIFNASSFHSSLILFIISITSHLFLSRIPSIFFNLITSLIYLIYFLIYMFSIHYSYVTQAYRPPRYDTTRLRYVRSVLSLTVFTTIFRNLFICNPSRPPRGTLFTTMLVFSCVACPFTFPQLCNHQQHTYGRSCSGIYN